MAETTAPEIAALRRSPLHDLREEMVQAEVTGDRGVSIREIPFLTLIALRVAPARRRRRRSSRSSASRCRRASVR